MTEFLALHAAYPRLRVRRNRRDPWSRRRVAEHVLTAADLIWPVFVHDEGHKEPVASMPGACRLPLMALANAAELGLDMSLRRIDEAQPQFGDQRRVAPHVFAHRVDADRLAPLPVGEQIGVGRGRRIEQLAKDRHRRAPAQPRQPAPDRSEKRASARPSRGSPAKSEFHVVASIGMRPTNIKESIANPGFLSNPEQWTTSAAPGKRQIRVTTPHRTRIMAAISPEPPTLIAGV
ncbi:MAG: hypothetical protein ACREE2_09195 [Stellaceae bacterium]